MIDVAKKIHQEMLGAENILLVSHKNPDGDALSSGCALMHYLRQIDKNHTGGLDTFRGFSTVLPSLPFLTVNIGPQRHAGSRRHSRFAAYGLAPDPHNSIHLVTSKRKSLIG